MILRCRDDPKHAAQQRTQKYFVIIPLTYVFRALRLPFCTARAGAIHARRISRITAAHVAALVANRHRGWFRHRWRSRGHKSSGDPIPTWTWYVLAFCSFAIAQYMSFATLHKEVTSYRAKPKADISLHIVFDRLYELARKNHMHNDAIELAINSIVEKQRPAIS